MYRQQYPNHPGLHNMADMPGMGMGTDSHTQVSYRRNPNFLERIGSSLVGILVGIVLLMVAGGLLWWNEGRAVTTARSLDEGLKIVVPLQNIEVAFEQNNGKLVHLAGSLKTGKILSDADYGIAVKAAKLKRSVEMYQWVEHEKRTEVNEGDRTREEITYSYSLEWRSDVVKSTSFSNTAGHHNPNSMAISPKVYVADSVKVGQFELSEGLVAQINNFKTLTPSTAPSNVDVKLKDGVFFHGKDPFRPEVGDIRVTFQYAGLSGSEDAKLGPPDRVSMIARQLGTQLGPYQTNAGDTLEMLYLGDLNAEQIFAKAHASNNMITWLVRLGGWFLMFIGFACTTHIFNTLVDWLPIVRELVGLGVTLMNVSLSLGLSLTIIAIAWIRFRPLLGMSLLLLSLTPLVLSKLKARSAAKGRHL